MTKEEFLFTLSIAPKYLPKGEYPIRGEKIWVVGEGKPWPRSLSDDHYPYVVCEQGEIEFSQLPSLKTKMHHPEMCNNEPVIAAGIFRLYKSQVIKISNESGHYRPGEDSLLYAKYAFQFYNVPLAENMVLDDKWSLWV